MTNVFINHNERALKLVEKFANEIYTSLNADPSKTKYNHIVTVPAKQRNESNGWSNFRFDVCHYGGKIDHYNARVETSYTDDSLIIEATKIKKILRADIIIFPSTNGIFVSRLDDNGKRSWLEDDFYREAIVKTWPDNTTPKTYYHYSWRALLSHHFITEIFSYQEATDHKVVIHDGMEYIFSDWTGEIMKKNYVDYHLDFSHITSVQYDGKQPKTLYWCDLATSHITSNIGTAQAISIYLEGLTNLPAKSVYQRINRAYNKCVKTGKAYGVKLLATQAIINQFRGSQNSPLDENGYISIYVSNNDSFDVLANKVENLTDDDGDYKKRCSKICVWLSKNPNSTEYPTKWDDKDREIAEKILAKRQQKTLSSK